MPPTLRRHPLAAFIDQINAYQEYSVRQIADLMGLSTSSVRGMATYGWLPGGRLKPHPVSGRAYTWTGRQLLRMARKPLQVAYDHETFSPATLYRIGCRCEQCQSGHADDSRQWRREQSDRHFSEQARQRVLELVEAAVPVPEAAAAAGITAQQVYGLACRDAEFAEALDDAAWELCVLGRDAPGCGTAGGYSRRACRGTGCREWRRQQSRTERAKR